MNKYRKYGTIVSQHDNWTSKASSHFGTFQPNNSCIMIGIG